MRGSEAFVCDLKFMGGLLPSGFLSSSESAHMVWGGKYYCQQPVPDSFRKPAGLPLSLEPHTHQTSGCASEDPCSFPIAQRGHRSPLSHPSPLLPLS